MKRFETLYNNQIQTKNREFSSNKIWNSDGFNYDLKIYNTKDECW